MGRFGGEEREAEMWMWMYGTEEVVVVRMNID